MHENRRQDDTTVQVIAERINALHTDVNDLRDTMKESMREMSQAIQTLVRLEERQLSLNSTAEETKQNFKSLETRVDILEKEQPMTKQVTSWVMRGVWAVVTAAAIFAAKTLGVM